MFSTPGPRSYKTWRRCSKYDRSPTFQPRSHCSQSALEGFYRFNEKPPRAIYVFRDGVSEGEFERVRQAELDVIRGGLLPLCSCLLTTVTLPSHLLIQGVLMRNTPRPIWPAHLSRLSLLGRGITLGFFLKRGIRTGQVTVALD